MGQDNLLGCWNFVLDLRIVVQRLKLALHGLRFEVSHSIQQNSIRNLGMPFAPCSEHYDLLVLQASQFGEPEHAQIRKMFAQQPRAFRQSQLRNDEYQHTTGPEPAIAMFEEH